MDVGLLLAWLLGIAVLSPLVSFALILLCGPRMGKDGWLAGRCATGAIVLSCGLSLASLAIWVYHHPPHETQTHAAAQAGHGDSAHAAPEASPAAAEHDVAEQAVPASYYREVYTLGTFGRGQMSISVYIDALTVCMFCMVTLIASCIHVYSIGYMHDELAGDDYVDHEVTLADGSHLRRRGRYSRFFQYLSLFSFSMLGLVLSGNIAMTFVFWELVGICSYFLIGFYIERKSASTAANKAFIVNRIGDFGMIIGLMAIWGSLGTFAFGGEHGIFEQVRPAAGGHALVTPDGMVRAAARDKVAAIVRQLPPTASPAEIDAAIARQIPPWRDAEQSGVPGGHGRWLLIVAGIGIFCGCIGKSAQFPLHVWLPDAMEGPTPVSALVHSATMVAAGVFLVARAYPIFTPEVLLVIAIIGTITLLLAATIAITATDIKRVLAYSTVSQLGYMMLALGVGGWLAGTMHLITHAFFKSLLFLGSGSVIHAVHTNDLNKMGGLRRKMPWTSATMLVGCLAIAGAGLPFALSLGGHSLHLGFSGYYSKDAILEQALLFRHTNPGWGTLFFLAAACGAAITAFYMFRLWYLAFAGQPRDDRRYARAHESPPVIYRPLVLLAVLAIGVAWGPVEGIVGSLIAIAICGMLFWRRRVADQSQHAHGPGTARRTACSARLASTSRAGQSCGHGAGAQRAGAADCDRVAAVAAHHAGQSAGAGPSSRHVARSAGGAAVAGLAQRTCQPCRGDQDPGDLDCVRHGAGRLRVRDDVLRHATARCGSGAAGFCTHLPLSVEQVVV